MDNYYLVSQTPSLYFDLDKILHISGPRPEEPYHSLIRDYLGSAYQAGYAITTLQSYGWHLHHWGIWLQGKGVKEPGNLERRILREWGCTLREKYQPQTQKLAITAIKKFNEWLVDEGICESDFSRVLRTPIVKVKCQRTLTMAEVSKMLNVCHESPKGIRDAAMIAILVDTGLRANELCNLKLEDVRFGHRKLTVLGKGGAVETGYFSVLCSGYLRAWLEIRASAGVDVRKQKFFFVSLGGTTPGQKLTPRGLRIILRKIGERAGVENVTPHAFRRSFATLRIKLGQSTRSVQVLGRWKDLKVFERYTQALLDDDDFGRGSAGEFTPLRKIQTLN